MTNQELQEQLETLKEVLENEKNDLAMREKWLKETKARIVAIQSQIENIENTLKEDSN